MNSILDTLGIDWDADERTIKRAYAKLIKEYRPDSSPVEFVRIREAYERALQNVLYRQQWQLEEVRADESEISHAANAIEDVADSNNQTSSSNLVKVNPETELLQDNLIHEAKVPLDSEVVAPPDEPYPIDSLIEVYAVGGEQQTLIAYHALQMDYQKKSLDAQMDLEDALLRHFLYGTQFALQVFDAANNRYDWLKNQRAISQQYGNWALNKLEALQLLAHLFLGYSQPQQAKHSRFWVKNLWEKGKQFLQSAWKHRGEFAFLQKWQEYCKTWELEHLAQYFKPAEPKKDEIHVGFISILSVLISCTYFYSHPAFYDMTAFVLTSVLLMIFLTLAEGVIAHLMFRVKNPMQIGGAMRQHLKKNYRYYFLASIITRGIPLGVILVLLALNYLAIAFTYCCQLMHAFYQQYKREDIKGTQQKLQLLTAVALVILWMPLSGLSNFSQHCFKATRDLVKALPSKIAHWVKSSSFVIIMLIALTAYALTILLANLPT